MVDFWDARIARQQAIDASIAAKAEYEYLYDKPYVDPKRVRVAGPFTVESLSPHRTLGVDEDDDLIDPQQAADRGATYSAPQTFEQMNNVYKKFWGPNPPVRTTVGSQLLNIDVEIDCIVALDK